MLTKGSQARALQGNPSPPAPVWAKACEHPLSRDCNSHRAFDHGSEHGSDMLRLFRCFRRASSLIYASKSISTSFNSNVPQDPIGSLADSPPEACKAHHSKSPPADHVHGLASTKTSLCQRRPQTVRDARAFQGSSKHTPRALQALQTIFEENPSKNSKSIPRARNSAALHARFAGDDRTTQSNHPLL